jgi:hypothetical protein
MPGTLSDMERVAAAVERSPSVEAAANVLRPAGDAEAVTLVTAVRWVRLRVALVRQILVTVRGLLPELFAECAVSVASFRARLGTTDVLVALRGICEPHLHALPAPLGLNPPPCRPRKRAKWLPQSSGPDPPLAVA